MKAHDDAQLGVLDVLRHQAVNRTPSLHARQIGHGLDHIANGFKGHHAQLDKTQLETLLRRHHQVLETLHIFRTELGNLIEHLLVVVAVVKVRAIVKPNAVERRHQAQINMVFHLAATQCEQLGNQVRQGDDGGACVKGETVLLVHIGAAAWGIEFFQHLNAISFDAQTNGCRQATKARANHNGRRRTPAHFRGCAFGVLVITTAPSRAAVCVN